MTNQALGLQRTIPFPPCVCTGGNYETFSEPLYVNVVFITFQTV